MGNTSISHETEPRSHGASSACLCVSGAFSSATLQWDRPSEGEREEGGGQTGTESALKGMGGTSTHSLR